MSKCAYMAARGRRFFAVAFSLIVLAAALLFVRTAEAQDAVDPVIEERASLNADELQVLVGPIALYPDSLVSILLPASTYPLQIVQAARYLKDHETDPTLKPSEEWDDSVIALLNYPEVIELMNADLDWTRTLGEAAVYQQAELMDAIQVFRDRAYAAGNLKSDERQVVTKSEEVIIIEPADPEVIYVPYYEPEVVVVRHVYPVYRYYPRPYPVYYYPYPYNHSFVHGLFWGVALAFTIDWHSHHLHVHHHRHRAHPYYGRYYHTPYYRRLAVRAHYRDHIWKPRRHHHYRQRHAVARVKANRRIDAALADRPMHWRHRDRQFAGPAHERANRARGPRRNAHGRDKTGFVNRDHVRLRKHARQRSDRAGRRSDFHSGSRPVGPRSERPRAHSNVERNRPRHSSRELRSNRSPGGRSEGRHAPRQRIERGAMPRRGVRELRARVGPGSRGTRSFAGAPPNVRPSMRPRSDGGFRSGNPSAGHKRPGFSGRPKFSARAGNGGRGGFGGGSRRHIR